MSDLSVFQRLRDAAVRADGIQMKAAEVDALFEREGERILNHARKDDQELIVSGMVSGGQLPEEEEEEDGD